MGTSYRHGTNYPDFGQDFVPPRVTFLKEPSVGMFCAAVQGRLSPALYPLLCRSGGYLERRETPWNAEGNARTVTPTRSRKPEFRLSSQGKGMGLSRKTGIRITSNAPATLRHGGVTVTSRGVTSGGDRALPTGRLSKTGLSPNFSHPQLAGRPCRLTSGGVGAIEKGLIFLDRPLNCLFINVQKKGDIGTQKTQRKPAHNPLGFHGGSHG